MCGIKPAAAGSIIAARTTIIIKTNNGQKRLIILIRLVRLTIYHKLHNDTMEITVCQSCMHIHMDYNHLSPARIS